VTFPRTEHLIKPFQQALAAYLAAPALIAGLALDEVAGQLKQAAASELRDDPLVELLHRTLQAVRAGDAVQVATLGASVAHRLEALGLPPQGQGPGPG
jgi:hypothetical protein